jgi:hypothetical protein
LWVFSFLKKAKLISAFFRKENYEIIEGKAICVFNGNARIEFDIPKQKMKNQFIFITNLNTVFNTKFE